MIKSGVVTAVEEQHGWGLGVPLKLLMLLEATGRWGSVLRQGLIHVGVFHDWEVVESTLSRETLGMHAGPRPLESLRCMLCPGPFLALCFLSSVGWVVSLSDQPDLRPSLGTG